MTTQELSQSIKQVFAEENQRLVFWYDTDREFEERLGELDLTDVTLIHLKKSAALEVKILLEMTDTTGRYLIYAPYAEPPPAENWLLDIGLYSRTFHADQASIVLKELGLNQKSLRQFLIDHAPFFRNQERLTRLKKWVTPDDGDADLELKMLAVLARAEHPEIFQILMKLLVELSATEGATLISSQPAWDELRKYGLEEPFWRWMALRFGYCEQEPSLRDLLIRILVTDFSLAVKGELPPTLRHFVLPNRNLAPTAAVFADQWRCNTHHFPAYNLLSTSIAKQLNLEKVLDSHDDTALLEVMTFEAVERQIIRSLKGKVITTGDDTESLRTSIVQRQNGHWAATSAGKTTYDYHGIYDALLAAARFFALRSRHAAGLSFPTIKSIHNAYITGLYGFDQQYRLFLEAADQAKLDGSDVLKELREKVEECYDNWYLDRLALAWGGFMAPASGEGLLQQWRMEGTPNQQNFYREFVTPAVATYPQGRIYVVISDALRYEVGAELADLFRENKRFDTTLRNQLGVLPSYTALGMAAILPHEQLSYKENGNVEVDRLPADTLDQRAAILGKVNGTALKSTELLAMSRDKGREAVKPYRIIYIYHNEIDATGDSAQSEPKTFAAARNAIRELEAITRYIINNLNGSLVLITADHGFLYQDGALGVHDKSNLEVKPEGMVKAKKRYLLGRNLGSHEKAWHGATAMTAGTSDSMEFWVPKGCNRFHFAGGARYTHGGAMPQEVIIPVITVRSVKEWTDTRQVGISLLGMTRKIVNSVQRFEFIQTEAISEKVTPMTVTVSLRDGEDVVSNEVTLVFDSASNNMDERKKSASINIKAGSYDKQRDYHLVIQNKADRVEIERIPLTIDLALGSDF